MDNQKVRLMRPEEAARNIPAEYKPTGARENPRHTAVTAEERHRLIAHQAYLIAERRGFAPGSELDDWLKAEAEIDSRFRKRSDRHSIV